MTEKRKKLLQSLADNAIDRMHRENSDNALQSALELMLTDRPTDEVVAALRVWADYLEDRQ